MIFSTRTTLLASVAATLAGTMLASAPALAQDASSGSIAPANSADSSSDSIVVTGSRIRRDNFETPSPINVITREDRVLAGARTTAAILQSSSITSGTSQINGSFLGYVSENGPAAESVGLRGMGSSRTLVLLNGRRLSPAGAGPQLVAADLNVLPTAIVNRIEIIREGASSVYGSDAIAGVVNIITDTKLDGLTFDAFSDQPVEHGGGGRTYRASLAAGKTFDRGHITASVEYRQTTGLRVGDRGIFSCPRDLFFNPTTGEEVGAIDPATGKLSCFPYALGTGTGTASGYGIAIGFTGQFNRITYDKGDINSLRTANGLTRVSPNLQQLDAHVLSPVKTYTAYLNGAYELGMLGDAEIYSEALFTRRESHQDATYQLNIDTQQLAHSIEIYGGSYQGSPLSDFGYPTSPFFPNSLAAAGYNYFTPFVVPNRSYRSAQRIDFIRANAGLRGNIGLGDWRYDGNFQYSHTKARQNIGLIEADLLSNALSTVIAPAGTPENLITRPVAGQAGFGNAYTCASNVNAAGALISGASCVPLNMYAPDVMINGRIPDNVYNYLFRPQINRTTFTETIATFNVDGSLFNLPGGAAKAALGYEHRHNKINDVPSPAQQAGTLYNYSSGGITKGSDTVDEVYGELSLPLLADRPFVKLLELTASGRYTHYKSYGENWTYRFNGQWAVNDIVKFRGAYGTAFRAPNLYEQYVADQTGFFGGEVDPCSDFANAQDPSSNVYKNCLAQLTPILGDKTLNYLATSGPKVITRGGAGLLKAEKSRSYGFGVVISTPPTSPLDVSLAVDYWNIHLKGEVAVLNNLVLDRCYEADDFPNNEYCNLIAARRPATDPQRGTLSSFINPYINVAQRSVSGIDFDFRLATPINDGKFILRAKATRNLHQYYQEFSEVEKTDYNGTLGTQNFPGGPKWVGSVDAQYTFPGDRITFRYGLTYVGKQDSTKLAGDAVAGLGLGPIKVDLVAEPYWEHGLSVQYKWDDIAQITFGVNNLFNTKPPRISSFPTSDGQFTRIGNYYNSSNYNLVGRSLFLNVTRTFK